MAQLKEHMLHDIFFDLLRRPYAMHIFRNSIFPGIGNFVLSGKGPFRVFRQIVADDFAITSISPDKLLVSYRGKSWRNGQRFLNTLFAKWTRKVGTMSLYWFTEVRTGYVQILAENHDVEAIGIYYTDCVNWIEVLKSFPNLVSLGLTREQFTDMIAAATELKIKLDNLDTVALSDRCSEGNLFDTLKVSHTATHMLFVCPCGEMRTQRGIFSGGASLHPTFSLPRAASSDAIVILAGIVSLSRRSIIRRG
uniref:FBA_2 domain-containing protein n=1 Tax=Panagrellus redivivus TaxID=6233 RepID=A0A7E4V8S5_PANRE